jgi:hypothetical protein
VVIKTIQLAVDQYIIEPEQNGDLPSRSLMSLDIRNMFNAVSCERLREIILKSFQPLNHMLTSFTTAQAKPSCDLKMVNGTSSPLLKVSLKAALYHLSVQHSYYMTFCPKYNLSLKDVLFNARPQLT